MNYANHRQFIRCGLIVGVFGERIGRWGIFLFVVISRYSQEKPGGESASGE
jgi:hypothetical protein